MRPSLQGCSLVLLFLLAPLTSFGQAGRAQRAPLPPLSVKLPRGQELEFKIRAFRLDPSIEEGELDVRLPLSPQASVGNSDRVHRWLVDEKGKLIFGYDLVVEALPGGTQVKVSAHPLDAEFAARLAGDAAGAEPVHSRKLFPTPTLVRPTETQTIADGGSIAIDVLINEGLGLKIVDYIRVASAKPRPSPVLGGGRDFTVTNVELSIKNYRLVVDGEALSTAGFKRSCAGSLIWFAVPMGGRFIFSLSPREGYDFRKAGLIEGNKIVFAWEGVRYEWVSEAPVVGGGGTWNLWVLHDPAYVDIFAPPARDVSGEKPKDEGTVKAPLIAITEKLGKPGRVGLEKAPRAVKRVWVQIGGASSADTLLPKR